MVGVLLRSNTTDALDAEVLAELFGRWTMTSRLTFGRCPPGRVSLPPVSSTSTTGAISRVFDPGVVHDYCVDNQVSAWTTDEFTVLDFASEDHAGESDFDYDAETLLSGIVGVRAELAASDLRPLYLAWLAAYGLDDGPRPNPPGARVSPGPRTTTR